VPWHDPLSPPPFAGAVFVFTNVRKRDALVAGIRVRGGEVVPAFSGRVTVVVADDKRTDSSKLRQATNRVPALPVLTVDELTAAFDKVPVRVGAPATRRRDSGDSSAESAPDDSEDDSSDA
jgi:BRCT domain type II-containing protein